MTSLAGLRLDVIAFVLHSPIVSTMMPGAIPSPPRSVFTFGVRDKRQNQFVSVVSETDRSLCWYVRLFSTYVVRMAVCGG